MCSFRILASRIFVYNPYFLLLYITVDGEDNAHFKQISHSPISYTYVYSGFDGSRCGTIHNSQLERGKELVAVPQ